MARGTTGRTVDLNGRPKVSQVRKVLQIKTEGFDG
jgi:hypothetical protein